MNGSLTTIYPSNHLLTFKCGILTKLKKQVNAAYQLEEDEGEDAGEETHDGNPHDDFEDVVFVEGLVL